MSDPRVEERIRALANELHERLTFCLANDAGPEHDAAMGRACDIREEIKSYGYPVLWDFSSDTETLAPQANVTILQVKEDLTPELQAIYDKWLFERAARKRRPA